MSMDAQFDFGRQAAGARRKDPDEPRRILVLSDLSGREHRQPEAVETEQPVRIDIDNFETIFKRLDPQITLPLEGAQFGLSFSNTDDLHPDALLRSAPFEMLREARQRMNSGASRESVLEALRASPFGIAGEASAAELPPSTSPSDTADDGDESDLKRLLGREASAERDQPKVDISQLLQNAVKGHVVPSGGAEQGDLEQLVNSTTSNALRAVLHCPAFQLLEASWMALRRLVFSCSNEEAVQFFVLNVPRRKLISELGAAPDWRGTSLHREIVEGGRGPWDLLAGDFSFSSDPQQVTALAMMGGIAAEAGAPFLAGASPTLLGCDNLADSPRPADWSEVGAGALGPWNQLRKSGMAAWLGLLAPRVLLRLPYGATTSPIDAFDFEELTSPDEHNRFLWGGHGLVCAELAARAYDAGDDADSALQLDELPVYTYSRDGEVQMKPCAEVFLSELAAAAMLERGLMPVASFQNRDAARLVRWQSIADPPAAVAGL